MSHPFFYRSSLLLAITPLLFGLNGILRPEAHLKALQFPLHKDPEARKLNYALMRIWGIRNLSAGFLLAVVWSVGDEKLMGLALTAGLAVSVMDAFVSRSLIGGGEGQHLTFTGVCGFVMMGLFGWFG